MILNTIADLQALSTIPSDNHAHVLGYNTPADGGGGDFYWDAASTDPENYGTVFESPLIATGSSNPGRWRRYYSESVNLKWFGAVGDGTTNDSPAFQKMIDFCEKTGIKDAIIAFGDFYLEESVHVKIGGIKFIGQGCLLREESWWGAVSSGSNNLLPGPGFQIYGDYNYNDAIPYKGSVLIIKNDISGIVYDPSVCDSVYWRGVGFLAENGRLPGHTYAIDFKSQFQGPTWPFNVHECHFRGFNRVFNFESGQETYGNLLYNIASINITNCAFSENDEVIYQGFGSVYNDVVIYDPKKNETVVVDTVDNSNNRFTCWGLNFQNNKAHHNSRIIYGYFAKDLVTISDNNLEGNNNYSDGSIPPYIIDIEIDDCSVKFHGNHFESVSSDCVSISSLRKNADGSYKATDSTSALWPSNYVDIYGNNLYGVQGNYKEYTLTGCVIKINEVSSIYVHACEILENSKSYVGLTNYALEHGSIVKITNKKWLPANFIKELSSYTILRNPSTQAYLDSNGEQWIRTKASIFNLSNDYSYNASDINYCVSVYKVKNNGKRNSTQYAPRYAGWSADTYVAGTTTSPLGESLIVCVFPEKTVYGNVFRSALELYYGLGDVESTEVCSSVFSYLTSSLSPEIVPVFESSNVVGEVGTFEAGQTWFNGTNLRIATTYGTAGTLSGVTVVGTSGNKIQLSSVDSIAQGQYIVLDDNTTYRIIELRGDWATLNTTPSITSGNVNLLAPTFSDIVSDNGAFIQNQNASSQSATAWINGNFITDGKIGIGTSTPAAALDISGGLGNTVSILRNSTSTGYSDFRIMNEMNSTAHMLAVGYTGSGYSGSYFYSGIPGEVGAIGTIGDYPFEIGTNNTSRISVLTSGNVGIATTTPAQKLDVNGTIRQATATAAMLKANSSGDIVAATAGTDYVAPGYLDSGTYTPTVTAISGITDVYIVESFTYTKIGSVVHVAGTIKISPDPYINPLRAMNVSLPIASDVTVEYDIAGVANGRNDNDQIIQGATICGDPINDNALVVYEASDEVKLYLQFDYTIQ